MYIDFFQVLVVHVLELDFFFFLHPLLSYGNIVGSVVTR